MVYFFLSPTRLLNRFLSTISLYGSCCSFDLVASFAPKPGCFFWFGCFFFSNKKINPQKKSSSQDSLLCVDKLSPSSRCRRRGASAEAPGKIPGMYWSAPARVYRTVLQSRADRWEERWEKEERRAVLIVSFKKNWTFFFGSSFI